MEDEFSSWDCRWYWDNAFASLISTGTSRDDDRSAAETSDFMLADSAFCDLEADSVCGKESYFDEFRLFITQRETNHDCCLESSPSTSICDDDAFQSRTFVTAHVADDGGESSCAEVFDVSDQESVGHRTEWDGSSSRVVALSSSCCLTETRPVLDSRHGNELDEDEKPSCASMCDGVSQNECSHAGDSASESLQHRPLIFFIIGLFVGLSLGFFTCIVTVSAAFHKMHLEIVNGRDLYSQCQHQFKNMHANMCTGVAKVSMDEAIGAIWREKFEQMVVENAELQLKLTSVEGQMSESLDWMQDRVGSLNVELSRLKWNIDESRSSPTADLPSPSPTDDDNDVFADKTDDAAV